MNKEDIRLALIFKDLAAWIRSSCVGLNVAGFTTAKYLNEHGVNTTVFPVRSNVDIVTSIDKYNETHDKKLTHVVISAPWLSIWDLKNLLKHFHYIEFVILSHSNVSFLQADPSGVELFRKYAELTKTHKNLKIGGNSKYFAEWFKVAYEDKNVVCLPNLYPLPKHIDFKIWDGVSKLKIGVFGAIRPEKNFMCAAAAALAIKNLLNVPLELNMIVGGECKSETLLAIEQMTANLPDVTLIKNNWEPWDKFIKLVSKMDLLIQVSFTESFNMVTADGVACGVSSVVSDAIKWCPVEWRADADDVLGVANVGIKLLTNNLGYLGAKSLNKSNQIGFEYWLKFLLTSK